MLAELQKEGKIRHIGLFNVTTEQFAASIVLTQEEQAVIDTYVALDNLLYRNALP